MAIALNRGNVNSARTSTFSSHRVNRVPSASVWEPSLREPRVNNVRTLGTAPRTVQRNNFEHHPSNPELSTPENGGRAASVRSNIALGAVFGAAVFMGTLFAGFNTPEEPMSQVTSVSSSPTAGEAIAR